MGEGCKIKLGKRGRREGGEKERRERDRSFTIEVNLNWRVHCCLILFQILQSEYPSSRALAGGIDYTFSNGSTVKCITAVSGYCFQCVRQIFTPEQLPSLATSQVM